MRSAAWYVIQVQTGKELGVCEKIRRACAEDGMGRAPGRQLLRECFAPRYTHRRKRHGEWVDETCLLLPGYVIAVTDDPWGLFGVLKGVLGFTRLLTMGKTFAPLREDEKSWIERWTCEGERTIPMSVAHKVGDQVMVTEGPLVGQEALITRVNRRKGVAHLEIHAGQMTIRTTVGLAVLPGAEG